jgi:hypothetical protein
MCGCIATAEMVSPRNVTVGARVRSKGLSCGIREVQRGQCNRFFSAYFHFPLSIVISPYLNIRIHLPSTLF